MLPIPMFLLLVFSVAVLAPAPAILIHFMKTVSLSAPPSHISTMPALPSSISLPPAVETLYLPIPVPQTTLDVVSVCLSQSFVDMASNITAPPLRVHEASDFTTRATILPVVVLAMVNCLVYRLLVDDTNGTRSEELEQPAPTHLAHILSEESPSYYTIYEISSPRPVIDTITTGFLERDGLSDAVTVPSRLELGSEPQSGALFEQSSQFPGVLSYGVLPGNSEQATVHDSTPATLSVSGCTSCDDWTQEPTAQSTGFKGSSSVSIASVTAIKYSGLVTLQCGPLAIEAAKTSVDHAKIPPSQEPGRQSGPQDINNPTPPPAVEGACDANDVREAFLSHDPEGDDDGETFDYKGVDWEPRAPVAEICATSPYSPLEPHFEHDRISSKAETSSPLSTSTLKEAALQSSTAYASDDILVGVKYRNEARIAYDTRRMIKCASAGDLRGMVDLVQETRGFPGPDSDTVTSLQNIADKCISINQIAPLRADLPVFTTRTSAMGEEVASSSGSPQPVLVGLKGSIHAPRNDDPSRTRPQECIGTLDSMNAIKQECPLPIESQTSSHFPEAVSAADGIQESIHSAPKTASQGLADPAAAESSTPPASGLAACPIAPAQADTRAALVPEELAEIPVPQSAQATIGSNAPRGLAASMHALKVCLPSHAKKEIAGHSADAPNWAAVAREDSTAASRGSSLAQRGKTPDQGLDDGDESDGPTATRCAIRGENQVSGVDDSDGSTHPAADDRDGAAGSSETDSGLDAADDPNEQESATRSRRSRRRGKPRRPRTKVPYLPPPRMRNLTQHPIANMLVEAHALHRLAAGLAVSNGQYYSHALPQPASASVSGSIVPPQAVVSDQFGQPLSYHHTPEQHMGSLSTTDFQSSQVSGLQSLTSHYPVLYPQTATEAGPLR
ncbi:hypothetical protein EDB86DRAFT_3075882 [Lactarius hatsudake]|nr:hypothetical protein EDB86DRAFT_3075882 [Lactarius hatsudake]